MEKHLKQKYGHSEFRPYQKDIIDDILSGNDVVVKLPTGGGKSICYQFPATFTKKITVVVCPLISLMTDQKMHLSVCGIEAMCLNSETYTNVVSLLRKKNPIIDKLKKVSIIYCTPEFITSNFNIFKGIADDICLFAIDEAHCLSEWGHDFRPSYLNLSIIKKEFPSIPVAAFTATATPVVLEDIFNTLGLDEVSQYSLGTKRENLSISVREKSGNIFNDLSINPSESTIIYTQTRKEAEKIHALLLSHGIDTNCYHGGMSVDEKAKSYDNFINDKVKILVATICFGMGIDKPDIRKIINYGAPSDIETYYQEIGRAGRDGLPSETILFWGDSDFSTSIFLMSKSSKKEHKQKCLNTFRKYITNVDICRQVLIDYYFEFGAIDGSVKNIEVCNLCDNCVGTKNIVMEDVTSEFTLIVGLVNSLNVNYGITKLIGVLRGSRASAIEPLFDNHFYGKGSHYSIDEWKHIINSAISMGILDRKLYNNFTVIGLGDNKLEKSVCIPSSNKLSVNTKIDFYRTIRDKIAYQQKVAPYMIIDEKVLRRIADAKPTSIDELLGVEGVSHNFICDYGDKFIVAPPRTTAPKTKGSTSDTNNKSYNLFMEGKSIKEISLIRELKTMTIEQHIVNVWATNVDNIDCDKIGLTKTMIKEIKEAVDTVGVSKLKPIKERVNKKISYFQIKVCLLLS